MTSLIQGAKKLVGKGPDLASRLDGLEAATEAAEGRLDADLVAEGGATVTRARDRLRLSADHTVVAIAGATGSGKSSTFNALVGLDIAAVGVRRPTTSWASACLFDSAGGEGAGELLEWLGIPARHQVTRDSMLDRDASVREFDGVVLLDLPDHDSTEVSHHLEVDRLVRLADMFVWVLDPQKYADAALHERYLRPLAGHAGVMLVVLNHLDTVPEPRRESMLDDVRRLLAADGLGDVPVLGVSARTGQGVDALKAEIVTRVRRKKVARQRLESDVRAVADRLAEASGAAAPGELSRQRVAELGDVLAESAGVPTVVTAVESSTRVRANRATGWPVVAWFSKLRPDPLKRLHLDLGSAGRELTGVSRTSLPEATPVQRARVDSALRSVADDVTADLAQPWQAAVRTASLSRRDELGDALDRRLADTDLGVARIPWWATAVRLLQWLLIVAAVVGAVWLLALFAVDYVRLPDVPTPEVGVVPVPTLLLLGGVGLGVVLALVCRVLVSLTARSRAATAQRRLRAGIDEVAQELVVEPIETELSAYRTVRDGLARARE